MGPVPRIKRACSNRGSLGQQLCCFPTQHRLTTYYLLTKGHRAEEAIDSCPHTFRVPLDEYWAVSIPVEFPARAKNQSWLESDSGEVCLPFTPKPVAVLVQGAHEAIDHGFRFGALPAQASSFPFCPQAHFLLTDLGNQPQ